MGILRAKLQGSRDGKEIGQEPLVGPGVWVGSEATGGDEEGKGRGRHSQEAQPGHGQQVKFQDAD